MQITHVRTNDSLRRSRARRASLLGWLPVAAAVALSGCTVKKTEAPDITGPSELGLSLELRVSPDVLNMDGVSQSTLTITSRDSNGKVQPNVDLRVEALAGGEIVDVFGRLSNKNVKTGGDGRATLTYTAPNSPLEPEQRPRQHRGDAGGHSGRLRLQQRGGPHGPDPAGAAGCPAAAGVRAGGTVHDVADQPG